jgi:hypothetical protein
LPKATNSEDYSQSVVQTTTLRPPAAAAAAAATLQTNPSSSNSRIVHALMDTQLSFNGHVAEQSVAHSNANTHVATSTSTSEEIDTLDSNTL